MLFLAEQCRELDLPHLLSHIYSALGLRFHLAGESDRATEYISKASEIELDHSQLSRHPIVSNSALLETKTGNPEEGLRQFSYMHQLLSHYPNDRGWYFYHSAYAYHFEELNDYEQALLHWKKAIETSNRLDDDFHISQSLLHYCQCAVAYQVLDNKIQIDIQSELSKGIALALKLETETLLKSFAKVQLKLIEFPSVSVDTRERLLLETVELQNSIIELKSKQSQEFVVDVFRLTEQSTEYEDSISLQNNLALVNRIGERLSTSNDLASSMKAIYESIQSIIDIDAFAIGRYSEKKCEVFYDYFIAEGEFIEPFSVSCDKNSSLTSYCINRLEPIFDNYLTYDKTAKFLDVDRADLSVAGYSDVEFYSVMFAPIILNNEILGVVTCQSRTAYRFREYHYSLFKQLTSYLAVGLKNLQQRELLEEQKRHLHQTSITDALTQLYNRQSLAAYFAHLKIGRSDCTAMRLLLIDIDFFKQYNDAYGHVAGDDLLKQFSRLLVQIFDPEISRVFRYGGDEFLVVLEGDDIDDLKDRACAIQDGVAALDLDNHASLCSDKVTISLGGCSFTSATERLADEYMIHQVDLLMYQVKQKGRNSSLILRHEEISQSIGI